MLPLKFQAWYRHHQLMCEVLQLKINHRDALLLDPNQYDRLVDLRELDIRQYTGMNDIKNVELYFGDMIRVYLATFYGYYVIRSLEDLMELRRLLQSDATFEIIGNIYQHPFVLRYIESVSEMKDYLIEKKESMITGTYGYSDALKDYYKSQGALDEVLSGSGKTSEELFKDVQRLCKIQFKGFGEHDLLVSHLFFKRLQQTRVLFLC